MYQSGKRAPLSGPTQALELVLGREGRREPPAHPGNAFGESLGVVRGARETAPLAGRKPLSPKHLHCDMPVPLPLGNATTAQTLKKSGFG